MSARNGVGRAALAGTRAGVHQLLRAAEVIAVVGLSANPDRASNQVAWYLHHQGYRLFGVNPNCPEPEVFGLPVLPSLDQVPEPIDIVDVFRRPQHTPDVARDAVGVGARAVWLQMGIRSPEARAIAEEAGLTYVEDRCLKLDHARPTEALLPVRERQGWSMPVPPTHGAVGAALSVGGGTRVWGPRRAGAPKEPCRPTAGYRPRRLR